MTEKERAKKEKEKKKRRKKGVDNISPGGRTGERPDRRGHLQGLMRTVVDSPGNAIDQIIIMVFPGMVMTRNNFILSRFN